jgi:nicotinate-nucleotide adenylyltransferase
MRRKLRIGLFGGSFDPVHTGHLELAKAAKSQFKLDKVIFIPAKYPPHKLNKKLVSPAKRLKFLSAAIKPFISFSISRYELNRRSTTYTHVTAAYFKKLYPGAELFFIIGTDSLAELATWKNIEWLADNLKFIAGRRPGVRVPEALPFMRSVLFIKGTMPDVSSTRIRGLAASGRRLKGLVPENLEKAMLKSGVYKC